MLSLLRSSTKMVIIETDYLEQLTNYLYSSFAPISCTVAEAFENSTDDHTIVFIVEKEIDSLHIMNIENVYLISEESDVILCSFYNDQKCSLINNIRIVPRILIMRAFGDFNKVLEAIKKDHPGTTGTFNEMLENQYSEGVILALTEKSLLKKVPHSDFYPTTLFLEGKYSPLRRDLRSQSLKYLNQGLDNKDWHELEIKIYDQFGAYLLHYQRLVKILEYLDLGIILGESWGQDTALIFNVIIVYRLQFFTFYESEYIKKLLLGLEYLEDGTRIVDFDVFHYRKKISWTDVKEPGFRNKLSLSNKYRNHIFEKLDPQQLIEIRKLENEILKTRF